MSLQTQAAELRRLASGALRLPHDRWPQWYEPQSVALIMPLTDRNHIAHLSPARALALADALDVLTAYRDEDRHWPECARDSYPTFRCDCGKDKLNAAADAALAKLEGL